MGLFSSFGRFLKTLFGLAEGGTHRAADNLLTASPDAIRNQFRKTREDLGRDYNEMKDAIAELVSVRDDAARDLRDVTKKIETLDQNMASAIAIYKKNQDERLKQSYSEFAEEKEKAEARADELEANLQNQDQLISSYKEKLKELQGAIENLKKEEAETVADIVSAKKISELNAKLGGLSTDTATKNLDAIREKRKKAKAAASLTQELSADPLKDLQKQIASADRASKYTDAFDKAVALDKVFVVEEKPAQLPAANLDNFVETSTKKTATAVDKLFD